MKTLAGAVFCGWFFVISFLFGLGPHHLFFLICCTITISHRDLQDIKDYEEGGHYGYFRVVEVATQENYSTELSRFSLFLIRMATAPLAPPQGTIVPANFVAAKLPETLQAEVVLFVAQPTWAKFQAILRVLFEPMPVSIPRDGHPLAWYVHLRLRSGEGEYKSIDEANQLTVRLVYAARLACFQQLTLTPPDTEEGRETLLTMTKLR